MKKFVFVYTGSSAKGGLSTYYRNLFENYPSNANKIALASFGNWAMPEGLQRKGYEVLIFPKSIFGIFQFSRYLKKEKFDVVVTGGVLSNFIGRIAAGNIPVVTVVHSIFETDYPGAIKRALWSLVNGVFKKRTTKYISVSEFLKKSLISEGVSPEKIKVIYNGIEALEPLEIEKHKKFQIVSVGRLHRTKGFDRLIHATQYLSENFEVKIWGEGPERDNLSYLIEKNKLSEKVRLCGASKDIRSALSGANLYVQTSRMEGFGLAVAEAMTLGIPVAVTPAGALPEIVENGRTGIVFNSEDPKEMAKEIIELSKEEKKLESFAENGRKSVIERFNVKSWAKEIDSLLNEVAK